MPVTPSRYAEIADALAAELPGLAPGTRLAGEHAIGARFGVGRAAARAALQELEARLLVRRVQGLGTFVNHRIDYTVSQDRRPSFHDTLAAAGGAPRTVVRDLGISALPKEQAAVLELPVGEPSHRMTRDTYNHTLLVGRIHEWVPVTVVPHLDVAMRVVESLDEVLRQTTGRQPVRAWCRVSLDVRPPEVCAELQMARNTPVWLLESVNRDGPDGPPVMCSKSWMRSDAVRVVVELGSRDRKRPGRSAPGQDRPRGDR